MSGRHYAAEGRDLSEVTHLALLGVKMQVTALWVICEKVGAVAKQLLFVLFYIKG